MNAAEAGQRSRNSRVVWIDDGASDRAAGSKPIPTKKSEAVVVRSQSLSVPIFAVIFAWLHRFRGEFDLDVRQCKSRFARFELCFCRDLLGLLAERKNVGTGYGRAH